MEFQIREYKNYNRQEILALYQIAGWSNYTSDPDMLEEAYRHSLKIYAAYIEEKLIGVIRVTGDGYSVIVIQDILVFPEYQRQGIGRALIRKILEEYQSVYQKILLTDNTPKTIQFYRSMGFSAVEDIECRALIKMW